MEKYFDKWMESEKIWINEKEKKLKNQAKIYSLLMPIGVAAIFGVIGLLCGVGMDGVLSNLLYGFIGGIIIIPFFLLLMLSSYPSKRYKKSLKKEIEDVLSPDEKENFAKQIMGIENDVKCISWINTNKEEIIVRITKDYALKTGARGDVSFVQLKNISKIKNTVRNISFNVYSGDYKIKENSVSYPMEFYYKNVVHKKDDDYDNIFVFDSKERRYEVTNVLKEVMGTDDCFVEED